MARVCYNLRLINVFGTIYMSKREKPLEPEIKSNLINFLMNRGTLDSGLVINEFTVGDFSRRVDLAVIQNNRLLAFEVKSDADSLIRLEGQVEKYLQYFDKVTVVTAPKHTSKALELTPNNVAVWEIVEDKITIKRRGSISQVKNKNRLIEMMTANELYRLSKKLLIAAENKRRKTLESALKDAPVNKLRSEAISSIKLRYKKRNAKFFKEVNMRKSTPNDLALLSGAKNNNVNKPDSKQSLDCLIDSLEELKSLIDKNSLNAA